MADKLYGDVVAGSTDLTVSVLFRSTTDSTPVTGVAAGSVTAYYWRQGASAAVQITASALASLGAAHSDGGWFQVSATNMPGLYRFDLPDAAIASGADFVNVQLRATGAFPFDAQFRIQSAALIPDQVLKRDFSAITGEAARSLLNAARILRNRIVVTPTALSVKKEDDNTEAWAATLSTTAGAAPITGVDPN